MMPLESGLHAESGAMPTLRHVPMPPLLIQNAWRITNVIASRRLGLVPKYLPVMVLFLTGRCNLRCRTCGVCDLECGHGQEDELTTAQWKAVIDAAALELGTTLAAVSGGEPLLRQDIYDIIRHATDRGISIHLCTNATLLDAAAAKQLNDAGVATVSVSLESPDPETHDYLRGADTYPAVVNAVRMLREHAPRVRVGINYLITRHNYKNMHAMVDFAESLGAHQIKFAPIHTNLLHRLKPLTQYEELLFREADIEDLEQEVRRARQRSRQSKLHATSDAFFAGISSLYTTPKRFRCHAGYAICAISPTGNVAPCCGKDSSFNVKRQSLASIWRDPDFHQLRKQVHTCADPCWDTTYTELSLLLRPVSLARNLFHYLRNMRFYFGGSG